ncbi:MAG: RNA polymerase sigma factor [Deltaproteobacteria bacterium]|nr:RNA polymerase sigma factor [Deltaproteobacteria bacterium]
MNDEIEHFAHMAKQGSKKDLENLIEQIQSRIYNLSLRILGYASDAEDATQEILIKIITHLSNFKGNSRFTTWSYRIAVNHLLNLKKNKFRELNFAFDYWEELGYRTDPTFDYNSVEEPTKTLLAEEVRIGCMQGMLQCLERKIRIAFILGELFELSGNEAAEILGITKTAYRKRLSRGRDKIYQFMQENCSLVNSNNHCHCTKLVGPDIRDKFIDPENLQFVGERCHAEINTTVMDRLNELDEIKRSMVLFRSYPEYSSPDSVVSMVKEMIDSKQYKILHHY